MRYNPLFVHGGSGVGKTHLVHAIGNALRRKATLSGPVACVSGSQFVDELIAALQDGTVDRWRARYRAADALIVDDVHALAGKERSQDELFHLFNAMHSAGTPDRACERPSAVRDRRARGAAPLAVRWRPRRRDSTARPRAARGALHPHARRPRSGCRARTSPRCSRELPVSGAAEVESVVDRVVRSARSSGGHITLSLVRRELERRWCGDADVGTRNRRQVVPRRREDRDGVAGPRRPRDRGAALMAIKGSLKEASLPDVLQLLAMGKKSGCLSVTHRQSFGYIYFDKGRICYASIVNRRDRLGDILVKNGLITQEQLEEAVAGPGHAARHASRRDPRRATVHRARRAAPVHPAADRRSGLLPVHLEPGDVQLRGGRRARCPGLSRLDQSRVAAAGGRAASRRVESHREEDPELRPRVRARPRAARGERRRS